MFDCVLFNAYIKKKKKELTDAERMNDYFKNHKRKFLSTYLKEKEDD